MNAQDMRLDYFKVYEINTVNLEARVHHHVMLAGQFAGPLHAELLYLSHFANPVEKDHEEFYNERRHLTWYRLYQQMPEPARWVAVENAYGQWKILIGRPYALLAPAQKGMRSELPIEPLEHDHYKLYWIYGGKPVDKAVELSDQFGEETTEIGVPLFFGVPVKKEHEDRVYPIHNEEAHLMIYGIPPSIVRQRDRLVRDQFGVYTLQFVRSVAFAVPTLKLDWTEMT